MYLFFFFQAEDGIRDVAVTGVQTCALPILLVTGDSVGQVASQTIENIDVISRAVEMPTLRPLIGDDKVEIIEIARQIGTYDISIQPDQDCCSLFVPKHPETKANLAEIEKSEARLNVGDAMKAAMDASEVLLEYPSYATGAFFFKQKTAYEM